MRDASERSQTQKAPYYMFPLTGHSRKDKAVQTENRLGVARGWRVGRHWIQRNARNFSGVMGNFCILMWRELRDLHAFFKIHITGHLKGWNYTFISLTLKNDWEYQLVKPNERVLAVLFRAVSLVESEAKIEIRASSYSAR